MKEVVATIYFSKIYCRYGGEGLLLAIGNAEPVSAAGL